MGLFNDATDFLGFTNNQGRDDVVDATNLALSQFAEAGGTSFGSASADTGGITLGTNVNDAFALSEVNRLLGLTPDQFVNGGGGLLRNFQQVDPLVRQVGTQSIGDIQNSGLLNLGANVAALEAAQGFGGTQANLLEMFRAQARPQEQNFANSTINRLFNTGRLGTTGGANAVRELSTALENADINRQVQATTLADQFQNSAVGRATQLGGAGAQRALDRFGLARDLFTTEAQGRQSNLGEIGALLGIRQGIFGQQLDLGQLALNARISDQNVLTGSGTQLAGLDRGRGFFDAATGLLGGFGVGQF